MNLDIEFLLRKAAYWLENWTSGSCGILMKRNINSEETSLYYYEVYIEPPTDIWFLMIYERERKKQSYINVYKLLHRLLKQARNLLWCELPRGWFG